MKKIISILLIIILGIQSIYAYNPTNHDLEVIEKMEGVVNEVFKKNQNDLLYYTIKLENILDQLESDTQKYYLLNQLKVIIDKKIEDEYDINEYQAEPEIGGSILTYQKGKTYNNANYYYDMGEYEKALEEYKKVIKQRPYFSYAYQGAGNCYYKLKKYNEAIIEYKYSIYLNPNFAYAHYGLANTYYMIEKYIDAIEEYDEALSIEDNYLFYEGKANTYYMLKRYQRAIVEYTNAINLKNNKKDLYHFRAISYYKLSDYKNACIDAIILREMGDNSYIKELQNKDICK